MHPIFRALVCHLHLTHNMLFKETLTMLINAYDSTAGKVLGSLHKVDEVIKLLHMQQNLTPTSKRNVYVLTNANAVSFSALAFPITLQTHTRETITVYDERPYRDSQNRPVNSNDITIMKLCAFLQQDVAEKKLTPLKTMRMMTARGFAEGFGERISSRATLNTDETKTLKALFVYYVACLMEQPGTDLTFLGENVIRSVYNYQRDFSLGVIEGLGHLQTLEDLLNAVRANPVLYKLKGLGLKDFTALVSSIVFTGFKGPVVAAAAETPCLLAAFAYGASRFKLLNKTPMGMAFDPKYAGQAALEAFWKNIDYTYDLNR